MIDNERAEKEFIYSSEEEWWSLLWSSGSRHPLEKMTLDVLEKFKAQVFQKIQANKQRDGIHVLRRVLFTLATSPAD